MEENQKRWNRANTIITIAVTIIMTINALLILPIKNDMKDIKDELSNIKEELSVMKTTDAVLKQRILYLEKN